MSTTLRARCTVLADLLINMPDGTSVDLDQLRQELPAALRLEQSKLQLCLEMNESEAAGLRLADHEHGDITLAEVHEITADLEVIA